MIVVLPLRTDANDYDFQCTLDNVIYTFRVTWNTRTAGYYLEIATEDGDILMTGKRVTLGSPLTMRAHDPRLFSGAIVPIDQSSQGTDAGLGELGDRVQLLYYSLADIVAGIPK